MAQRTQPRRAPSRWAVFSPRARDGSGGTTHRLDPLTGSAAVTKSHVAGRPLPSHSAKCLDAAGAALVADAAPVRGSMGAPSHRSLMDAAPAHVSAGSVSPRASKDAASSRSSTGAASPRGSLGAVRPFDTGDRPYPPPLRPMKNPGLDRKQLLDLYYYMRLNRSLEERLVNLYRQGGSPAGSTAPSARRRPRSARPTRSRPETCSVPSSGIWVPCWFAD